MDLRRLRVGEWLAALSGVALLVSLFLPWYGPDLVRVNPSGNGSTLSLYGDLGTASGWESLSAIDVLLALVAASGVLLAIITAAHAVPAIPIAVSALVTLAGLFGLVLVLLRVLDLPGWAGTREWGLWLGLAGALGIIAGSLLAMREESLPGAAPVEIEPISAPRP